MEYVIGAVLCVAGIGVGIFLTLAWLFNTFKNLF